MQCGDHDSPEGWDNYYRNLAHCLTLISPLVRWVWIDVWYMEAFHSIGFSFHTRHLYIRPCSSSPTSCFFCYSFLSRAPWVTAFAFDWQPLPVNWELISQMRQQFIILPNYIRIMKLWIFCNTCCQLTKRETSSLKWQIGSTHTQLWNIIT